MVDFSKHIEKAEEAIRRRNYDFAVEVFHNLLDIDADLGEARAGLRKALKLRHASKKGGAFLRKLGGTPALATAKTLRKAGKNAACAKALESYLASNPMDEEANLMLGMALEDSGSYKSARAVYEFVAEISPKNPEGLKRAGAMMYRTGEIQKALEYYERALEADPRDQEALKARKNLAAEAALSTGGYETAFHSRDRIVDKDEAQRLERSRRAYRSPEELAEDRERLEARFAEDSTDTDVMVELAGVCEKLKDYETALDLVERALSYKQTSFELVCQAGDLRSKVLKRAVAKAGKAGDEAEASRLEAELISSEVEDFRRRTELHPSDAALRVQLAKRLMRAEEPDGALAELQRAVQDGRMAREAHFLMAQCFQIKGFSDLARKEYERALEGASGSDDRAKEILYNLGLLAEAEGQKDEARGFFARVFEVDIGYRDVAGKMEQLR